MYIIVPGNVASGMDSGPGKLVVTRDAIFVFKASENLRRGAMLGGLLGVLIGHFLDHKHAKESPPAFLSDPDLAVLKEKERRQLIGEDLLVKYERRNSSLTVEPVAMGIRFNDGSTGTKYSGLYKTKVLRFLESSQA